MIITDFPEKNARIGDYFWQNSPVCLTKDGQILSVGENVYGQCDTWKLE